MTEKNLMGLPNKQTQKELDRPCPGEGMHMYAFKYLELVLNSQLALDAGHTHVYQKAKYPCLV